MFKNLKLTLLIALFASSFTACNNEQKPQAVQELEIGYINAKEQKINIEVELQGRVKAKNIAQIRPQINGIIEEQLFVEGTFVKKDDVLYKIDNSTYKAKYNQANAQVQSANAVLNSANSKLNRAKELIKFDGISKQEYDDINADYLKAKASVEEKKADLENAKIDLNRCEIKAPISGYIGISNVTKGALVNANQSEELAVIRDTNFVYVDLNQSYQELLNLKSLIDLNDKSNEILLKFENDSIYEKSGKLLSSELNIDENSGTVTIRTEFENINNSLISGMFVKAIIKSNNQIDGFLIPQQAVLRDQKGEPIVTILDENNKTKTKIVTIQKAINNKWLISSGINKDDLIIIEGLNKINPRSRIVKKDLNSKYED